MRDEENRRSHLESTSKSGRAARNFLMAGSGEVAGLVGEIVEEARSRDEWHALSTRIAPALRQRLC
jgi:hypothetical protein